MTFLAFGIPIYVSSYSLFLYGVGLLKGPLELCGSWSNKFGDWCQREASKSISILQFLPGAISHLIPRNLHLHLYLLASKLWNSFRMHVQWSAPIRNRWPYLPRIPTLNYALQIGGHSAQWAAEIHNATFNSLLKPGTPLIWAQALVWHTFRNSDTPLCPKNISTFLIFVVRGTQLPFYRRFLFN